MSELKIETQLRQPMDENDTSNIRDRLIRVAARHFAEHGFQGASQRAIQREVGVNNSTVNYYFGSKESLYCAVLEEALSRIQATRISGFHNIPIDLNQHDHIRALMTAYLGAHLRESGSETGYNYLRIVASLHLVVPDIAVTLLQDRIAPVRELYVDALAKLFPNVSRNRIYEMLSLTVGLAALAPFRFGAPRLNEKTINRMIDEVVTISTAAFETHCDVPEDDD